jgi:hypothetical protein
MSRLTSLTASLLTAAVLAPAAVLAASGDTQLRSHPQMFRIDADTVQVRFTNDDKVRRARVVVADLGTGRKVRADGRHGDDHRYTARVDVRGALQVGRTYTVRIAVNGDATPAERLVVLRAPAE